MVIGLKHLSMIWYVNVILVFNRTIHFTGETMLIQNIFFISMLSFKEAGLSTKLTNGYTLNWIRYGMLSCKLLFMCFFLYIYIEPFLKGNQDSRKMATTIQPTFSSWCTIHFNIFVVWYPYFNLIFGGNVISKTVSEMRFNNFKKNKEGIVSSLADL